MLSLISYYHLGTPAVYSRLRKVTVDQLRLAGYTTIFLLQATSQQVLVVRHHDNLPTGAGQWPLFGPGSTFVSNLHTPAGLWPLFGLLPIRQDFCADNLPASAGCWPVFGPMTATCQPQLVIGRFSDLINAMSVTCTPP